MIRVSFHKDEDHTIRFVAKGHANTAPKGADLVCAGITTLAYGIGQNVKFADARGQLERKPSIKIKEGRCFITFQPKPEHYAKLLYMMAVHQTDVLVVAANHPDSVRLTTFDEDMKS